MEVARLWMYIVAALFLALLVAQEAGRRFGLRRMAQDPDGARAGAGVVDGAVFALLGLLIAFTFTGAASRFQERREMIVTEANAIGTAWLRLDLLPAADQAPIRTLMRDYVDTRLRVHELLPDLEASAREQQGAAALQAEIWALAEAAVAQDPRPQIAPLVLPALNEMFDVGTTRAEASRVHVPSVILLLLLAMSILAALLAGFAMASRGSRPWLHSLIFASIMALTLYVILDLEYPRAGFIRVSAADRVLVELRDGMR
jgi:hypothetical protein